MYYIWFLCLLVSAVSLEFLDDEIESQCIENCSQQNQTDKVHYGYACDHNCHIDQCTKGCSLWKQALSRTCHEACQQQSPQTPQPPAALLYCTAGCSDALSRYSAVLRGAVGRPPAPALLADSLAPTHLRLEWRPPKLNALAALGRHVQWRYEDAQPQGQHQGQQQWQYARAAKWDVDGRTVLVEGLQPYSKYRFRIALLLGPPLSSTTTTTTSTSTSTDYGEGEFDSVPHPHFSEPIAVSQESVVIVTPADGPPASPPSSVRAAAVDPTTVSIAWEPGPFPRGPLLSYVLHIEDETHEEVINKDVPPDNSFVMVRDLHPGKNYTIEIRMRNKRGSGPPAVATVSTPTEPQTKDVEQPPLMLGTEYSILELTHILDEPTNEFLHTSTKNCYSSPIL
nr:unnamed protein product [Callosobruchus chinensis]